MIFYLWFKSNLFLDHFLFLRYFTPQRLLGIRVSRSSLLLVYWLIKFSIEIKWDCDSQILDSLLIPFVEFFIELALEKPASLQFLNWSPVYSTTLTDVHTLMSFDELWLETLTDHIYDIDGTKADKDTPINKIHILFALWSHIDSITLVTLYKWPLWVDGISCVIKHQNA
jgi:hypothetical protein